MPSKTFYELELQDEVVNRLWQETQENELNLGNFFFPETLTTNNQSMEWKRGKGISKNNTIIYHPKGSNPNEYHITCKSDMPGILSVHETTKETKGESDKDSVFFIDEHNKLEWDKDGKWTTNRQPTANMLAVIEGLTRHHRDKFNKVKGEIDSNSERVKDIRERIAREKSEEARLQQMQGQELFTINIRTKVEGLEAAQRLASYLSNQVKDKGIKVDVKPRTSRPTEKIYSVQITTEAEPLQLHKQTEIAINQAIKDWTDKDNAQSGTPAPEKTTSAVGGPLSRFEDPKLFADDLAAPTANPELRVQEATADPNTEEKNDSHHNKLLKQDGGGRGSGGRKKPD